MAKEYPKIPVERYMQIRSAHGAVFSHDDSVLYFQSNLSGTPQVWRLDEQAPWPRQISYFAQRVMGVSSSPTKDLLAVSLDTGGNERAQIYLMDGEGLHIQDITADPDHIYQFGGWSHDGQILCYASNRRDGTHFDVYLYELASGTHRLVHQSDATNYAHGFTPDDQAIVVSRHYAALSNDLFLVGCATGESQCLTPHEGVARFGNARFTRDGRYIYLVSDHESEFTRLQRLDRLTKERVWLTDDQWDVGGVSLSHDDRYLSYTRNENGSSKLYVLDLTADAAQAIEGLPVLPEGTVHGHFNRHGYTIGLTVSSPVWANEVWLLDVATRTLTRATYASISGVPQETFVKGELIAYPSFDGRMIPAYYYRPKGDGPFPVIVEVHGGPEGQSVNSFASLTQYFVQRGYAVLKPNVRGSSGYGRTYLHLDDVRKRMDSVADLAHAVSWLKEKGHARADAIAVMGGSYGGFMVLAAVTHYPELFAAGVDIVGIANLRSFMEHTSSYRRHLRESEYGTIEQDGAFFDEISPIHHVDRIKAPMFIVHGANDPRVPVGEAEQMVAALRARNHPVEYLRFEDEGHGVAKLSNRILTYTKIADFLDRFLS